MNPVTAIREIAQSAEEETETNYIDSNLPDDSDNIKEETEYDYIDSNLPDDSDNTKEETEYDYIDSNLPDDSDDGLEQNNEAGVYLTTQFWTIWISGNKCKEM